MSAAAAEAPAVRVEDHLGLVGSIARKYLGRGLEFEDLYQVGCLGLIEAARRYDPSRGFKFSTYAYFWIRQKITRALEDDARTIRIPVCQQRPSREPSPALDDLAARARRVVRESQLGDVALADLVPDRGDRDDPHDPILLDEARRALAGLDDRSRAILDARYPLDGRAPASLRDLGVRHGISPEAVRMAELRALAHVRAAMHVAHIPVYPGTPLPGASPMIATNGTAPPVPTPDPAPGSPPARPPWSCPDCGRVFISRGRHDCRAGGAPAPRPAPPAPAPVISPGILGELDAMRAVVQAMQGLDAAAARRVLDWVAAHYREARS